eukprot:CAMPEP_0116974594 /NCGR_PEP_ID=MMETSP0467-20121206/55272_1 /TAXON_ID=283647 /ORGANISM="Mesodinium pulex, Strain SPMC105" /LENGTH=85 /DNA_ID=CAMNT_0004666789 /DNA_START=1 /DNA_END=255 /DNA_ORIENTATION=-
MRKTFMKDLTTETKCKKRETKAEAEAEAETGAKAKAEGMTIRRTRTSLNKKRGKDRIILPGHRSTDSETNCMTISLSSSRRTTKI